MSDALRPVPIAVCPCPGAPHPDGDVVYLHPELGMDGGMAAQAAMWIEDPIKRGVALYGAMIDYGIAEWTFVDADGRPEPIEHDTIRRLLPWQRGGAEVSHAAAAQYGAAVMTPFAQLMERVKGTLSQTPDSSPTGPTESSSTLPNRATRRKRPKR